MGRKAQKQADGSYLVTISGRRIGRDRGWRDHIQRSISLPNEVAEQLGLVPHAGRAVRPVQALLKLEGGTIMVTPINGGV